MLLKGGGINVMLRVGLQYYDKILMVEIIALNVVIILIMSINRIHCNRLIVEKLNNLS